ncbi:glutathione-regulated potassium-efflux system protein, KefB/KefC family [Campylobacter vulpis]|uniref:cation:proton antiporter n=1 Tax=Campylobacter vulpis TaxID=1655500 RepID=UPI000C15D190|nr:cation:proton antiporter [Campylobacter vulpis]MBS4274807.1 potassium transporter [Campylobacter vulpis]MBS4306386.1 potassium transporter [Campylobacter vulpis]MBS4422872.1 potassium transporter [Campylobacter vulpis]PHY90388.1 potassium transporter [Campylobacter vulpis]QNF77933.1 glutathione-regulated potassium-efflux system protein, KefB/KefC family [Campylobacter vulpis]
MGDFLEIFLITSGLAVLLNVFFKKFEIPTIIGYILVGIIISYAYGFSGSEELTHIAEFGIVFLMFTIGLEFSFTHLMAMKKEVFLNGSLQVIICGLVCFLLVLGILGLGGEVGIIVGFALALSSTAVVLKILNDSGDIKEQYGRKTLGILIFQDIAVIPLLLLVDIFSSNNQNITQLILTTLISVVILLTLLYLIGKYLIDRIFHFVIRASSNELFILTILFIVMGASFLAHYFGFSYSLGAFIAGVLIAETKYKHKIEADLVPFRDLLLGLFFISVGMQINFKIVFENWDLILLLTLLVGLLKFGVIFGILVIYNKKRVAIKTAFSIAQIGEFALAVFSLLQVKNMLDGQTAQILIVVSIITMILTPFVLNNIRRISNAVEDIIQTQEVTQPQAVNSTLKNHIVIFGYGIIGQEVVQKIKNSGVPYLVLENDLNLVKLGLSRGENVYFANAAQEETLKIANIKECAVAIITIFNEARLAMLQQALESYGEVDIVIYTNNSSKKLFYSKIDKNVEIVQTERVLARALISAALEKRISKNA